MADMNNCDDYLLLNHVAWARRSQQLEKARAQQWGPNTAKNKNK